MASMNARLKSGVLTTWDAFAQSFGFLGPVFSLAFLSNFVAAGAGIATPLAIFIAGLGSLAVGYVVASFATRLHAAGAVYNYVIRSVGAAPGFVAGWLYFGAATFLTIAIFPGIGGFLSIFLSQFGLQIGWLGLGLIIAVLVGLVAYLDVRVSTRVQLALVLVSMVLVLLAALSVIASGGASGLSLEPFNPARAPGGLNGVFTGLVFGLLMYTGYESAAVLGEETANPRRSIPVAILGCVVVVMVYYLITTYSMAVGFGLDAADKWASDPTALFTVAGTYGGPLLANFITLAAIIDAVAVCLGTLNVASRMAFAMARDGILPRLLSATHPVHRTPFVAAFTVIGIGVVSALLFATWMGDDGAFKALGFYGGIGAVLLQVVYGATAVSLLAYALRERRGFTALHYLVPFAAIVAVVLSLYGATQPNPDPFLGLSPWIALVWIVLGLVVALALGLTRRDLMAAIGRHLVEVDESSEGPAPMYRELEEGKEKKLLG
jgi:amino acid transporter